MIVEFDLRTFGSVRPRTAGMSCSRQHVGRVEEAFRRE